MYKFLLLIAISISLCSAAQTFPDSEKDGKYVTVNGARLWVITVGKGQPIILIAGGPGNAHVYMRPFDSLAQNHMLVYFDAFGRGKSDTAKDVKEYSLERDIDDVEALRIALNFKKIDVLGHSYGGLVAQGYALKYPSNINHLVLANTLHSYLMWQENDDNSNHEFKTNFPEAWDSLMKIRSQGFVSSDSIHQRLYSIPYGFIYAYNPEHFAAERKPYPNYINTKLYYQMVGRDGDFIVGNDIGRFDYRRQLKNLKMPVLIYGGRYDRVAVPAMMVQFKQYCPQAKFVMFERSGHHPEVEQPGELLRLLEEFLGK